MNTPTYTPPPADIQAPPRKRHRVTSVPAHSGMAWVISPDPGATTCEVLNVATSGS